ncbi:hypothetical protein RR42_m3341 [Cupriavidus basilensis]|uniref:Uncharacterized protein n=1 Tax=Cupriavidus basilensis TaxID=68895 RepID=A0A0C4YFH5_9BURK|nr:hypothetical protein RR42_m3341 [Cupriavidus basilensis]
MSCDSVCEIILLIAGWETYRSFAAPLIVPATMMARKTSI